jgi:ABC-2 type transport system permease protein
MSPSDNTSAEANAESEAHANPPGARAPSTKRILRRLFLTLFLRGRSSRGLKKERAPKSVGQKLALSLFFYFLMGFLALGLRDKPVFALAVCLHSLTFVLLGMFVASSAGEVLFNKEEGDILLHRPIEPRVLLWAKIGVLIQISLWMAGALNAVGLAVGSTGTSGSWHFAVVHAISTALEALFCMGCVVMVYQLCLRWFGRDRLEGLMTTAQVVVSVGAVLAGQLLPQMVFRSGAIRSLSVESWWIGLLPPAWFAGLDDAIAGSMAATSWILAVAAVLATAIVAWLAFSRLARDYEIGLQTLSESISRSVRRRDSRRWIAALIERPPLRWWLRNPVDRASFLLTAAYLVRDRDVKLRVFPGMAPVLVLPIVIFMREPGGSGSGVSSFMVAFVGGYLGIIPMLALSMLQYSQQWRAADIFRAAPLLGPAPLCNGARRAVLLVLTLPVMIAFVLIVWLASHGTAPLALLLPGIITLPVYSIIPTLGSGGAVPLSQPAEDAKSIGRGLSMFAVTFVSMAVSGVAAWSWTAGWFLWFLFGEVAVAIALYAVMRRSLTVARWATLD